MNARTPAATALLGTFLPALLSAAAAQPPRPPLAHISVTNAPDVFTAGGFGRFLETLTDWTGDGVEEYAVSADSLQPGGGTVGRVYVYDGRTGEVVRTFDGGPQLVARFGEAVVDLGDVTGDGQPDIAISSPGYNNGGSFGRVTAFNGVTGAEIWTLLGDPLSFDFGKRLGAIASGVGAGLDLVVTDPGYGGSGVGWGRVVFVDGASGIVADDVVGPVFFSSVGMTLATQRTGSVAYVGDGRGRVYTATVTGGQATLSLLHPMIPSQVDQSELAIIENGGQMSLIIGRRFADVGGLSNAGTVDVYPNGGLTPSITWSGDVAGDLFGSAVTVLEDINGDGNREIGIHSRLPPFYSRFRAFELTGAVVLDLDVGTDTNLDVLSISDATGDGRGEFLIAFTNDPRVDTISRGLELTGTSTPGSGFRADFAIDFGPAQAGGQYIQLYGGSGTTPGVEAFPGNPLIPLNLDNITVGMLGLLGTPILPNAVGNLDGNGQATSAFALDPFVLSLLTGIDWHTTVVRLDPGVVSAASNPLLLEIP